MTDSLRILYVEDEDDIRQVAIYALEDDFVIEPCSSGQEALDKAAVFKPDLVLLDVMMPSMDGPTTLEELKKITGMETVPVVFLTAKVQAGEIDELKAFGAVDVIAKPFDPMTLGDQIRAILEASRAR